MGYLAVLTIAVALAAPPGGHIAYLAGTEQEDRTVTIRDVATGTDTPVGRGDRDGPPVWSPDGQWLAFAGAGDGSRIHIVRHDGTDLRTVSQAHTWNEHPQWSPDGTRLAYTADVGSEGRTPVQGVIVCDVATGAETRWGGEGQRLVRPVWVSAAMAQWLAADAARRDPGGGDVPLLTAEPAYIVAVGYTGESGTLSADLFLVTPDGTVALPLDKPAPRGRSFEWHPRPRPDGGALAFESNYTGDREVYILHDLGLHNLSANGATDWAPAWSPDGSRIAFESFRSGRRGVYVAAPKQGGATSVAVDADADNYGAAWSPCGGYLVFVSTRDGSPNLYIADLASGDVTRITDAPGEELAPAWRPEE